MCAQDISEISGGASLAATTMTTQEGSAAEGGKKEGRNAGSISKEIRQKKDNHFCTNINAPSALSA